MTTTVTAQTRFQPHCPTCKEELERERDKFEAWGTLMRHLQVVHPEVVEAIDVTRTVIEEDAIPVSPIGQKE